eukprot:4528000-Prymnesium_polylepis.1
MPLVAGLVQRGIPIFVSGVHVALGRDEESHALRTPITRSKVDGHRKITIIPDVAGRPAGDEQPHALDSSVGVRGPVKWARSCPTVFRSQLLLHGVLCALGFFNLLQKLPHLHLAAARARFAKPRHPQPSERLFDRVGQPLDAIGVTLRLVELHGGRAFRGVTRERAAVCGVAGAETDPQNVGPGFIVA